MTSPVLTLVCFQICPARLLVRTGRSSTSSDQRSTSKPRPSSLLISFKSSSTRTQIYLSVSRLRAAMLPHYGSVYLHHYPLPFLPLQCDPALLPEPNHVMLNHLYALSIKVRSKTKTAKIFPQTKTGTIFRTMRLVMIFFPTLSCLNNSLDFSCLCFCSVGVNHTNGSLPAYCTCLSAGRSDGAERNAQIQEEIRHLSALQAYLNLSFDAPRWFWRAACLYSAV